MKSFRLVIIELIVILVSIIPLGSTAFAAKPNTQSAPLGNDISWPQCGKSAPKNQAFGIVGINGGKVTNTNPCLVDQLKWAAGSNGTVIGQDKAQVYVNTANPGEVLQQYAVTTWPTDNTDPRGRTTTGNENPLLNNPYGSCTTTAGNYNGYTNDMACSWQYGWNRAVEAVDLRFGPAARNAVAAGVKGITDNPADYVWWLDVETMNSWQGETDAEGAVGLDAKRARNAATLEAMKSFFQSEGAKKVGLYSTGYQWGKIVGNTLAGGTVGQNLKGLDSWLAGAANENDAQKRCNISLPLTPNGKVALVQYISRNLDYDYSCSQ
jgi:hypothetical protein